MTTPHDVQVAVTLANIAYLDEGHPDTQADAMKAMLAHEALPTHGQWSLVWGPVVLGTNLQYIVHDPTQGGGRGFALAIRGTVLTSIVSISEDLELALVDIPWLRHPSNVKPRISQGIREAFGNLLLMRDHNGETAMEFLRRQSAAKLLVTGHSQGGCLATVMALYALEHLGIPVTPIPFAGQTAGNKDFADIYVGKFGDKARWFNEFDFIPMWWNYDTIADILAMYPGGPKAGSFTQALVEQARKEAGHNYFQPGSGKALSGSQVYDERGVFPFLDEIKAQHDASRVVSPAEHQVGARDIDAPRPRQICSRVPR